MNDKLGRIPLVHPGEHLLELIEDWNLTQYRLAKNLGVPQTRIMQIVKGQRNIQSEGAVEFYLLCISEHPIFMHGRT